MKRFITYCILSLVVGISIMLLIRKHGEIIELYYFSTKMQIVPFAISMVAYFVFFRKKFELFKNFFHELTHLVFAILFFERIEQFFVSRTSGELVLNSEHKNLVISLSPYFFPLLTLFLLLLRLHFNLGWQIVTCSYGFYFAENVSRLIKNKIEILEFSWYGIIFILLLNFWISLIIFSFNANNISDLKHLII